MNDTLGPQMVGALGLMQNMMLLANQPTDSPDWPFIGLDQPGVYCAKILDEF